MKLVNYDEVVHEKNLPRKKKRKHACNFKKKL